MTTALRPHNQIGCPLLAPHRDQLRRVLPEFLGSLHDRGAFADRFNGAKQLGRRGAHQIDVPLHRVCGHNTWSLRHAILPCSSPEAHATAFFPDTELAKSAASRTRVTLD